MSEQNNAAGSRWSYTKRGYAITQSLRQLKRYRLASIATLLVLGVTLALPAMLLFASSALQELGSRSVEGESITAYLNIEVSDLDGAALAQNWTGKAGVRATRFVSREEALTLFRQSSDLAEALDTLGTNPLPGAIMVFPDTDTLESSRLESLADELRSVDAVARVQLDLRWVKRLQAVVLLIQWVGGLLALFLTLTALMVISNTIRLELLRRQREMDVANLLGASSHFMNRPIIYTGALYGFLGGLIATALALLAFNAVRRPADDLSSLYDSAFQLNMPEASQILLVLAISVALGLIGAISSLFRPSQQLTHQGSNRY